MSSILEYDSPSSPSLKSLGSSRASSPFSLAEIGVPVDQIKEIETTAKKHAQYYFEDGNVIFQVEDTLYNVHRYFFARDSAHFRAIFQRPEESDLCVISGVNCADSDEFLAILYPSDFRRPTIKTTAQWTSILHLAVRWGFENIKLLAIDNLTASANPVDKIVLGLRYGITDWLPAAYEAVCTRADPLTLEEGMKLGVEDTVRISAARQLYGTGAACYETEYLTSDLGEIFRLDTPAEGSVFSVEYEEDAIQLLEEQVAAARTEHLADPTPAEGACPCPGLMWNGDFQHNEDIDCGSCGGCISASNERRVKRKAEEENERHLGDLNSRLEEKWQELIGRQSLGEGPLAVAQRGGAMKIGSVMERKAIAAALEKKKKTKRAIIILDAQIAKARTVSPASPTPPVGVCLNPTMTYTNSEAYNLKACDSCGGRKPESNEQRTRREGEEEKEQQLTYLKSRREERRQELIGRQQRMTSFR